MFAAKWVEIEKKAAAHASFELCSISYIFACLPIENSGDFSVHIKLAGIMELINQ